MSAESQPSRKGLLRLVRIAVSLGLLAVLYSRMDWERAGQVLRSVRFAFLPALVAILVLNSVLSAWKWKIILAADGIQRGLWPLLRVYLIGGFMNLFLPSTVGGDAYRIVTLAKSAGGAGRSMASVLADRLTGFIALSLLALVFGILQMDLLPSRWLLLLPLAATAGFVTAGWLALYPGFLLRLSLGRFRLGAKAAGFLEKLRGAMHRYREAPGIYFRVFVISFAFQLLVVAFVGLLLRAIGCPVPPWALLAIVPMISLVEALPLSIFGLGLRDAAYVVFLKPVGVESSTALVAAAFYVIATVLYVSTGGFLWAFSRDRSA